MAERQQSAAFITPSSVVVGQKYSFDQGESRAAGKQPPRYFEADIRPPEKRVFFASRGCISGNADVLYKNCGEMAEWTKAQHWKCCVGVTSPWVRIPLSPPFSCFAIRRLPGLARRSLGRVRSVHSFALFPRKTRQPSKWLCKKGVFGVWVVFRVHCINGMM